MTDPTPTPSRETTAKQARTGRGAASNARLIVIGIVAVFAILFIALNTHDTKIDFVFGSSKLSVIWVILLSIALGFALGTLLPQLRRRRRSKKG